MDAFDSLFSHFAPTARAFFSGNLCTRVHFDEPEGRGHLHVFRGGVLDVIEAGAEPLRLEQPTILLATNRVVHTFAPDPIRGADLVCATVEIGAGAGNPIAAGLPDLLLLRIDSIRTIQPTLDLLFDEAFSTRGGRQVALDRLFEYLLVQLIRDASESGRVAVGVLAALADPRLCRALTAMHDQPGRPWTLEALADEAGMSRTRFAAHFREVSGSTPAEYLSRWRMGVAQTLIRKGRPIKAVASTVGYDSPAALTRAFTKIVGLSPKAWAAAQKPGTEA